MGFALDILTRWKKAVIHLECAADSVDYRERIKQWQEASSAHAEGKLSTDELLRGLKGGSRDVRFHGTALFLKHEQRRYLLTARHVVWDERAAKRDIQGELDRMAERGRSGDEWELQRAQKHANDKIFSIIFRVPSLDELLLGQKLQDREFLMNLGAGVPSLAPYSFSDPARDLAVISLDQRNRRFGDEIEEQGYEPVSLGDIGNEPSTFGADVFSIGFPSAVAVLGQVKVSQAERNWASESVSLPVCAFGKVSMLHEKLDFFWCDMSLYPGNSGGPVVEGDKLVGIVSAQAVIPIESETDLKLTSRIPFGRIVKAKLLRTLVDEQIQKDNAR
jgi:Trypsin-like peptidase domain